MATGCHRRVIPIVGGRFSGERLSGTVLPGGADWNLVRPDGAVYPSARYTLRTDDGTFMITNDGLQPGAADTMTRILADQPLDLTNWYARTQPQFEVSGSKYAFLNDRIFVGDLIPQGPLAVHIEIDEIL